MKSPSAVPRYTLFCLSGDNTVHLYIVPVTWHWPFKRAFGFYSAITWLQFFYIFVDNFFIVRFYHVRHVLCARIANLYIVSVKDCVKFVRFWKVLIYQIQKSFSYVGGNVLLKGGLNQMILRERMYMYVFIYLFIYLFTYLLIYLFIHLFIYLLMYVCIYLFIFHLHRKFKIW